MTEQEQAAATFYASKKETPKADFNEDDFLMWGNQLRIDAVACSIDNPECESCSG